MRASPSPIDPSMRLFPIALAALVLLPACDPAQPSEDVNQARIFTVYELAYDGNTDRTTAIATFRFGGPNGTRLELSDGSRVEFEGDDLAPTGGEVNLLRYERTFANLTEEGTFVFEDADGETYENEVALRPIAFPDEIGPIDNDESFELAWEGDDLAEDEEVNVLLSRLQAGQEVELGLFTQRDDGAQSITLTADQLRNVAPGTVTLRIERKVIDDDPDETPEVGGRVEARYVPRDVTVEVVD